MGIIRKYINQRKVNKFAKKANNNPDFRFQINLYIKCIPLIQVFPQDVFRKDYEIEDINGYAILVLTGNVPILNSNFKDSNFSSLSQEVDIDGKKQLIFMERDFKKLVEIIKELLDVVFEVKPTENYTTDMIELPTSRAIASRLF
jgi:hypothetical protein